MSTTTLLCMTAAAMALSVAAGPVKAAPTQPVKNIVFVHGAFADGSSWAESDYDTAGERLQRHGGAESIDLIRR
jgi:hypothetical protein